MPPRTGGRHYDIAGLIKKLEEIHKELGDEKGCWLNISIFAMLNVSCR